jgi:glycosyltransferase involved in cell wall biosynthesis
MADCIIVVPCYNEAARLDVGAFREHAAGGHPERFLFVNAGSTDNTLGVLEGLRQEDPLRFDVCDLQRNCGKAEAVRHGMLSALESNPEIVGYWDADLATPLEAIGQFRDLLHGRPQLQIAIGARIKLLGRNIERRAVRHYLGRIFATAASATLPLAVYDTQCGAKLFRVSPQTRGLFDRPFYTNWVFDVEIIARFIRAYKADGLGAAEGAIYELPLERWRDVAGSKVRPWHFFKAFYELAVIYWKYLRPGAAAQ